ncbi:MAG: recombinase family protein [Candidatus Pelethousia sp.]|nr:recombinase family protein [Candidatus Pelethousia sp.]
MSMARAVTVIPPTITRLQNNVLRMHVKKRVAAYARVSTNDEEQQTSYEAQIDYYTQHIKANGDWEFVEVYTDEGISGTNTKKRDGFRRMVQDALDGKIDLILTKSVSRFARNTVDTLTTVRQLKEKGVEVYFEKENIYTLDSKVELLITIMSSLAQEESRSISENVTWGQRKRFADGKVNMPYKRFLGYAKGEDGTPKIVESEAEIVRLIYKLFLQGKTQNFIARYLTAKGIPTPGKKKKWNVSTVLSILQNEKYKGDAVLQKRFTVDFLTKTTKVNEGEVPQYYVENSHPAIIEPEVFDMVQAEIKRRKPIGRQQSGVGCFSGKIICGECGGFYGSKVWHSTSKYRRTVWQCNNKFKNETHCKTPHLSEEVLQRIFVEAFNRVIEDKERIIGDFDAIIEVLTDISSLDKESTKLRDECAVVMELIRKCVEENAHSAMDQSEYQERYNELVDRYETAKRRLDAIADEKQARAAKRESISRFLTDLKRLDGLLAEFDEELWYATVDTMTVRLECEAIVTFKNGTEIKVQGQEAH